MCVCVFVLGSYLICVFVCGSYHQCVCVCVWFLSRLRVSVCVVPIFSQASVCVWGGTVLSHLSVSVCVTSTFYVEVGLTVLTNIIALRLGMHMRARARVCQVRSSLLHYGPQGCWLRLIPTGVLLHGCLSSS